MFILDCCRLSVVLVDFMGDVFYGEGMKGFSELVYVIV